MSERRQSSRSRTYLGGRVIFNARQSTIDCVVKNLSEGGAKLVFPRPATLSDEIELDIPHLGRRSEARIAWRTNEAVGIAFPLPTPEAAMLGSLTRRIEDLERKRVDLEQQIASMGDAQPSVS